jgi:hypothetical protein
VIHVDDASQPQVTPLTATSSFDVARLQLEFSRITNVAISPDGSRVGFDTHRTSFALAPPSLISPPAPEATFAYTYEVNVALGTLQQVTSTFDGAPPNGEAGSISFAAGGQTLAFSSVADNLIFGTPTSGVAQVYLTHELPSPTVSAEQRLETPPATALPLPDRVLSATAYVQRDGSVVVDAEVPDAGRLVAQLTAQVPKVDTETKRGRRKLPRRARGATQDGGAVRSRTAALRRAVSQAQTTAIVPSTTIAQSATVADAAGEIQLRLHVGTRYRSLTYGKNGLYCLLRVTFAEPGKVALAQLIPLTVHLRAPAAARKGPRSAKVRTRGHRRSQVRRTTG